MFWAVTLSSANRILSDTSQNTFFRQATKANLLVKPFEVNGKTTSVSNEVYLLPAPKVLVLSVSPCVLKRLQNLSNRFRGGRAALFWNSNPVVPKQKGSFTFCCNLKKADC